MNLFIDTTNNDIVFLLELNGEIIDQSIDLKILKAADSFSLKLTTFLKKHNLTLKQISNFYVLTGPGNYIGERIGLTYVKTLKCINPKLNVFLMNSLQFQAGLDKSVSILDARNEKIYLGIYDNNVCLIKEQLLFEAYLPKFLVDFKDYKMLRDYDRLNFAKTFLNLKNNFKLAASTDEIKPLYIKSFL